MAQRSHYPRFTCPACGRSVASVYRDAVHATPHQHYAYVRSHGDSAGHPCPCDVVKLATVLPVGRRG